MVKLPAILVKTKSKCDNNFGNKDLKQMIKITNFLKGSCETQGINIKLKNIMCFQYEPLASLEVVERTFSQLNYVLSDRRYNLTPINF